MIKKLITLFKIGRKLALSDALNIISKIYKIPILIKIFFSLLALFGKKNLNQNYNEEERLCRSIESMGITFIKLGQFLATRPDIIGKEIAKELEKLQDKLPPFSLNQSKNILKEELGEDNFRQISDISEPIAAASIAQVHFAKINFNDQKKNVAIKVLRPNISEIQRL